VTTCNDAIDDLSERWGVTCRTADELVRRHGFPTARCQSVASAGRWLLDRVATIKEVADLAGHSDAGEGTD
jgi:hypothetical protein